MKKTEYPNNYAHGNGAYQEEYNRLLKDKVDSLAGEKPKTKHEVLLKHASRLNYQTFNNNMTNLLDYEEDSEYVEEHCYECDGTGEVENEDFDGFDDESDEEEYVDCDYCYGDGFTSEYESVFSHYELSGILCDIAEHLKKYMNNTEDIDFIIDGLENGKDVYWDSLDGMEYPKLDKMMQERVTSIIDNVVFQCITENDQLI